MSKTSHQAQQRALASLSSIEYLPPSRMIYLLTRQHLIASQHPLFSESNERTDMIESTNAMIMFLEALQT